MTECAAEDMAEVRASNNGHLWQYMTALVQAFMQRE